VRVSIQCLRQRHSRADGRVRSYSEGAAEEPIDFCCLPELLGNRDPEEPHLDVVGPLSQTEFGMLKSRTKIAYALVNHSGGTS